MILQHCNQNNSFCPLRKYKSAIYWKMFLDAKIPELAFINTIPVIMKYV